MNDAFVVRASESGGDLRAVAQDGFRRDADVSAEGAKSFAFDQLHDDVKFAVGLGDFVDGADVGVSERRGGAGFVKQILAGGGVEAGVLLDDFQGDIAMEDFVKCAVDDAHSAFANLFGNAVMADDLTDQGRVPPRNMLMRVWRCVNEAKFMVEVSLNFWRIVSRLKKFKLT